MPDPKDRRKEIDAVMKKGEEQRGVTKERREKKSEKREQELEVHEKSVREGVAQEEIFEEEHEKRLREFKVKEDERKKEIEIFQRKKREEEEKMLKRKEEEKKAAEQHKVYLSDMRKAGALRMRKEQRKEKSAQVEREMRTEADAEAYRSKQAAESETMRAKRRVEDAARKKRGDVDIWEREQKEQIAEETRSRRTRIDMEERDALQTLAREGEREKMRLQGLPTGMLIREEERMQTEHNAKKQKLEKDFQHRKSQIEVEDHRAFSDIITKAKLTRDMIASKERQELVTLEETMHRKIRDADYARKAKGEFAKKESERILHDIKPGEEIK